MKVIAVRGTIVTDDAKWLYDWFGIPATSPQSFRDDIEAAKGEDITLEINSYGGSCTAATEIRQIIMDYDRKITAHVMCAMSAATVIACGADEVLMSDTGIFMIHNSQSYAEGDYRDMERTGEALKQFNEGIINAYEKKTGLSREEIQALMDKDTYMSADKAIELGFADGVIGEDAGMVLDAAASLTPMIPLNKIMELAEIVKGKAENNPLFPTPSDTLAHETQNNGIADSDITNSSQKGDEDMTLMEFLAENADAKAEFEAKVNEARAEGAKAENERIKSLDAIASTVTPEALDNAKYGDEPMDGKELAYKAMVEGEMRAQAYMKNAITDSNDSGVDDVETGDVHTGEEEPTTEADAEALANYANNSRR